MTIRDFVCHALYHIGLLDVWHRAMNRNTLSVVLVADVIVIFPPLSISPTNLDRLMEVVEQSIDHVMTDRHGVVDGLE